VKSARSAASRAAKTLSSSSAASTSSAAASSAVTSGWPSSPSPFSWSFCWSAMRSSSVVTCDPDHFFLQLEPSPDVSQLGADRLIELGLHEPQVLAQYRGEVAGSGDQE